MRPSAPQARITNMGRAYGSGFSIVACLIANTLALSMLSASASADLVATMHFAGERMDQGIRLRQVNRYLDSVLAMAHMPEEWRQPKAASSAPTQWRAPSAPCSLPESLGDVSEWGSECHPAGRGPCLPGRAEELGLYIETIYPCPDACERGAVRWHQMHSTTDDGAMTVRWRAQWQQSLTSLEGCPPGTPWARLERIVLSHRAPGLGFIREQRLATNPGEQRRNRVASRDAERLP